MAITNNNVQNIKFLRNGKLYVDRDAALAGINDNSADIADGSAILARYGSGNNVKTLVGFKYVDGENKSLTIFDNEGAAADVTALRQEINAKLGEGISSANTASAQLSALSGSSSDASGVTSVFGAKKYAKEYTDEKIAALDAEESGSSSYVTVQVDEANGVITGVTVNDTIDTAIGTAISGLDADISGNTDLVTVGVKEVDGKIAAVTVTDGISGYVATEIGKLDVDAITAGDGAFIKSVSQADGKVSATTAYMPSVVAISDAGKAITAVSQSNGTIAATAGTINAEYVTVADSGELLTATTVEGALAEIADEIDAMDKAASAVDGQVVTTVAESDGVVSETKANVKDLQLGGYALDTTATGAIASTDTINVALSKLENKSAAITIGNTDGSINVTSTTAGTDVNVNIKSGEKVLVKDANSEGIYTDLDLVKITTGLPAEIKERYQFLASDDTQIGTNIDIPKDSHIVSISYIKTGEHAQNLEYVYINASGVTQTTYVDMSELVLEAEFASGVTVTDHVAHGVVDPTSENFLTVGADGFKLSGVQNAINTAISGLDATVGSQTVATGKHVAVEVVEADGKLTGLTVVEDDIASASALGQEITDRDDADTVLSNRLGASVTTANTASAQLSALSGSSSDGSGVTSVWGAKAYAKDYADEKVSQVVAGLDATVSGESSHVNVQVVEADGVITTVTVTENDIASATALTAEIAARKAVDGQTGQTYVANTAATHISAATSLNNADVKLSDALDTEIARAKAAESAITYAFVSGATMNGSAVTFSNNSLAFGIQGSSTAAGNGATAINVATAADGTVTLALDTIDAGTY